jgi:hypothetical protein
MPLPVLIAAVPTFECVYETAFSEPPLNECGPAFCFYAFFSENRTTSRENALARPVSRRPLSEREEALSRALVGNLVGEPAVKVVPADSRPRLAGDEAPGDGADFAY